MSDLSSTLRASSRISALVPNLAAGSSSYPGQFNSPDLSGKVAIITGGGSGIGQATALLCLQHGCKVVASDLSEKGLQQTVEFAGNSPDLITVVADVSKESENVKLVKTCVEKFGRVDIFFANAGIVGHMGQFDTLTAEGFDFTLRVNVIGAFLGMKEAAKQMIKQNQKELEDQKQQQGGGRPQVSGGSILITASVAGTNYGAGGMDYSCSKSAAIALARHFAQELKNTNIRVNSISPGLIETGMTKGLFELARERRTDNKIGQLNPLKRYGHATEIAQAALFLASPLGSYVNGQNLCVDGGLTSSMPVAPSGNPSKKK